MLIKRRPAIYSVFADAQAVQAEQAIETAVEQVLKAGGWDPVAVENVYWPDGDFNVMQSRAYDRAARVEVVGRVTMGSVAQEFHRRGYYRSSQKPVIQRVTPEQAPAAEYEMEPIVTTADRPKISGWFILAIIGLVLFIGVKR